MELLKLNNEQTRLWDSLIENYETKRPFHNLAWLEYLQETQGGKKRFFEIKEGNSTLGYFCGLEINKGPFKIFGSPLQGWNTPEMGPIINNEIDKRQVRETLYNYFQESGFSILEFANSSLSNESQGLKNYDYYKRYTSQIDLSGLNRETLWNSISSNCRTRIRKARKNNLIGESVQDDQGVFINEYYGQLKEVFWRRRLVPIYKKDRVEKLFSILKDKDMLLPIRVKNETGKTLATAIFIYDKRCIFLFGMASENKYLNLSPNELLIWTALEIALKKEIRLFDLGGLGKVGIDRFKNKFRGDNLEIIHWRKFYNLPGKITYLAYKILLLIKLNLFKWSL